MTEEKNQNELTNPISSLKNKKPKDWLIIIGIIVLGLVLINQVVSWRYKVEFAKTPCELCEQLNPHLRECFKAESMEIRSGLTGKIINLDMNLSINP